MKITVKEKNWEYMNYRARKHYRSLPHEVIQNIFGIEDWTIVACYPDYRWHTAF